MSLIPRLWNTDAQSDMFIQSENETRFTILHFGAFIKGLMICITI